MKAFTVDVNPSLLVWARTELGIKAVDVAEYLKTEESTINDWEKHGQGIRYTDLKRLATFYKRQVPVFFLPETPKPINKPKDFRNLSLKDKGLHRDTLLAVRRTSRYLGVYKELVNEAEISKQYLWLDELRNSSADTASTLRELLDAPVNNQREYASENFKFWRQKIEEKLNIFVFQFPIPNHEFDGFSYIENGKPYAITLNSHISNNRKVFTLFHELGHIIHGESGICLTKQGEGLSSDETRCNQFAAEFLMPEPEVIPPISFDELKSNAKSLGVSAEAYLIRCASLNLIDDEKYRELMAIIRRQNHKNKEKSTGGPPQLLVIKSQRGDKFFDFILSAYHGHDISASTVRDVLNLKVAGLSRQEA